MLLRRPTLHLHSPSLMWWRTLQGPATDPYTVSLLRAAVRQSMPVRAEILNYSKQGRAYWLELNIVPLRDGSGSVTHFAAIERDITAQRLAQEDLRQMAGTDPLTGLPNRRTFESALQKAILHARRETQPLALIAFDLDHFKRINDTHGHHAGDAVLRIVAHRLSPLLRPRDLLARTGGEEFQVSLPGADLSLGTRVAERLRAALSRERVVCGGAPLAVTASFGVTIVVPTDDENGLAALRRADRLMYSAKAAGRDCVHVDVLADPPNRA